MSNKIALTTTEEVDREYLIGIIFNGLAYEDVGMFVRELDLRFGDPGVSEDIVNRVLSALKLDVSTEGQKELNKIIDSFNTLCEKEFT